MIKDCLSKVWCWLWERISHFTQLHRLYRHRITVPPYWCCVRAERAPRPAPTNKVCQGHKSTRRLARHAVRSELSEAEERRRKEAKQEPSAQGITGITLAVAEQNEVV